MQSEVLQAIERLRISGSGGRELAATLADVRSALERGQAPESVLGDVHSALPAPRRVDLLAAGPSGPPALLVRLPARGGLSPARQLRLGSGSAWLPSRLLAPARPADEFVGLRIRGGTVRLEGPASEADGAITLSGAWRAVLQLNISLPGNPAAPEAPGADASAAQIELPARLTVTLGASGIEGLAFPDAHATAYGTAVDLSRADAPSFFDPLTRSLVLPAAASLPEFAFTMVRAELWQIAGSAPIARSGWAFPVTAAAPAALGEAAGAGALWLDLGAGLTLRWQGLPASFAPARAVLSLAPGLLATVAPVPAGAVAQRLLLWDEAETERAASVEVASAAGSTVLLTSQPGADAVLFSGRAAAHLDRPLAADGGRLRLRLPAAWLSLVATPAAVAASVLGADPGAFQAPHLAFALENALLKVRPPAWLFASGALAGERIASGRLWLRCPFRSLLPTLPDPYAASLPSRSARDQDRGWASARVAWSSPATPALDFQVDGFAQVDGFPADPAADPGQTLFPSSELTPGWVLLDVSSRADQLGVLVPERSSPRLRVSGLALTAAAGDLTVLTLPPISWEPMLTKAPKSGPEGGGDIPLPPPPHDGGPALLAAESVELVPIAPAPLFRTVRAALRGDRRFAARLPLPFGAVAHVERKEPATQTGISTFLNRPIFAGQELTGGLQLALVGGAHHEGFRDPTMPGSVELIDERDYAKGVLSENLHTRFGKDFAASVPLLRYDLSGYGASLKSDWRDPEAAGPAIIETRYDVLVGRTSHAVIQMQSHLCPWHARVVRTITIDRQPGGWVLREDSGWVPASDGRFDYRGDPQAVEAKYHDPAFRADHIHPGPILGVVDIRHIRLDGPQIAVPPGGATIWQPVRFDADVAFVTAGTPRLALAGGSAAGRAPSRGITGWILIDGPLYDTVSKDGAQTVHRVAPASAEQIRDLLQRTGPAVAPLSCTLGLGGTAMEAGIEHFASRVEVACTADLHLAATVRGTPKLPRDGAWSLARLLGTDKEPQALDPAFPLPLVRPTAPAAGADRWHFAEPEDILKLADAGSPATVYGFIQALGAQKVFFPRPRVVDATGGARPLNLPRPPKLADMGALLHAAGIFPGLAQAFDVPGLPALDAGAAGIGFAAKFPVVTPADALLADLGGEDGIELRIEYRDEGGTPTTVEVKVDPKGSPRWSISLARFAFAVVYKKSPLIRLYAAVRADERTAPTVSDLNVRYEAFLRSLQSLFSNIQQLARFLPGGKDAGLQVGFSQGHLTVRNAFALPNLPLGAGEITDVTVDMGFEVSLAPFTVAFAAGIGSPDKPFRWVVSPLAGTGVVRVGIDPGGLAVLVQAGLGLGLAIDLGVASGSASVTLAVELNTGPNPFEIRGILSGRASVDVLAGLASATLTLAAGLGIIPDPAMLAPPSLPVPDHIGPFDVGLLASVSVGIHITICWVVDVDFDGSWQFRQDIHIPKIGIPF
jgi:hypothetical protein